MNLLECTKVNTFFEFTKQNKKIFKKKFISFCKRVFFEFSRVASGKEKSCSRTFLGGAASGVMSFSSGALVRAGLPVDWGGSALSEGWKPESGGPGCGGRGRIANAMYKYNTRGGTMGMSHATENSSFDNEMTIFMMNCLQIKIIMA